MVIKIKINLKKLNTPFTDFMISTMKKTTILGKDKAENLKRNK